MKKINWNLVYVQEDGYKIYKAKNRVKCKYKNKYEYIGVEGVEETAKFGRNTAACNVYISYPEIKDKKYKLFWSFYGHNSGKTARRLASHVIINPPRYIDLISKNNERKKECSKVKEIEFAHFYKKFPKDLSEAKLIQVFLCNYNDLSDYFIKYSTEYEDFGEKGYYNLPKTKSIVLIFQFDDRIFTTIRRYTTSKYSYYKKSVGEIFNLIIK